MHILGSVKKKYNGKTIFGVTETTVDNEVHYCITLQDDKHWYFVKSDNRAQMEGYKNLKKPERLRIRTVDNRSRPGLSGRLFI